MSLCTRRGFFYLNFRMNLFLNMMAKMMMDMMMSPPRCCLKPTN